MFMCEQTFIIGIAFYGWFRLPDKNSNSNPDLDCRLNGYIVLGRTFSDCIESDSDFKPNWPVQESDGNMDWNWNLDAWM